MTAKIPVGEPLQAMSTGVRARPSITVGTARPKALDHDQASKGSLTPSVVLECAIPDEADGSFYRGQVHVLVKDSVLQVSTPFRHATELIQVLQGGEQKPVLFAYTDGGGDLTSLSSCLGFCCSMPWIWTCLSRVGLHLVTHPSILPKDVCRH